MKTKRIAYALLVGVALVSAACGSDKNESQPPSTTSTTVAATTSSSSTVPASTSTTTTKPVASLPAPVTGVHAGEAGGSGEVQVDWSPAARATGYHVYRSETPGGPFTQMADVDVVTGKVRVAARVANLWSDNQTFYPLANATPVPGTPAHVFHYVEYPTDRAYFRVAAYNAAGEGPPSAIDCGASVGRPQC
jgi:hypothetical protein